MFSQALHRQIFLFGLTVLVVGLSLGAIFISIGQIIISANWILERNFSEKFNQIKTQKIAWPYFLFFGLHLLGLLWTENLTSGVDDIKIKLPILALPLIFSSTRPLSNQELSNLLKIYLFALLAASLWSLFFYLGWKKTSVNDVRNLSRFFSHIRFSMHIVFGIFLSLWFYGETENKIIKIAFALISIWLVFFLFILSSLTGIVLLLILLIGYSIYFFLTFKNLKLKLSIFLVLILGIAGIGIYGYQVYRDFFTPIQNQNEKLELWTSHRDLYYHESNLARENGYFVWRYNAYEEIQASWNKKSNLNFDGVDKNGNPLRFTLIRYMTSKGLRKDEDDFSKLSNEDIRNIENGITNYKLAKASPIKQRIYEATWEMNDFIENRSMRDHSMIVRLEYWKTAIQIKIGRAHV